MILSELVGRAHGLSEPDNNRVKFICPICSNPSGWAWQKRKDRLIFGCANCAARSKDIEKHLTPLAKDGDVEHAQEALAIEGSHGDATVPTAAALAPPVRAAAPHTNGNGNGKHRDLLARVPPQNLQAEQSVLGAVLLDNHAIKKTLDIIGYEDFYRESHRHIYRAMLLLDGDQMPIDAITLTAFLQNKGVLDAIGGPGYIAELAAVVPTALNVENYARIVREKSVQRQLAAQATEIASLAYDNENPARLLELLNRAATVGEVSRTSLPILIGKQIQVYTGKQLKARRATQNRQWIVDGLLAERETSLWSGKVEAGKTVLMRTLCYCLLRGEPFLERETIKGRVLYAMLDADGEDQTYEEFERLGVDWERDPILTVIDPVLALRPQSFDQFYNEIVRFKPSLVVVDTLGRLQQHEDMLAYGSTYQMARLSELARLTGVHIAAMHHIPRGRTDNADAATAGLGSVAIAGGVNARFVCVHKPGNVYTLMSSKGKSGGFRPFEGEQTLEMDEQTGFVKMRGAYSYKDQARGLMPQIRQLLEEADGEELSPDDIQKELQARRSLIRVALKMLYEEGQDIRRTGRGQKGHPFVYSYRRQMDLTVPREGENDAN